MNPNTSPLQGFIPALSQRFELDGLLRHAARDVIGAALYAVTEILDEDALPTDLHLMIDSGGYAAFRPDASVSEVDGLGVLDTPQLHLHPASILALQGRRAHTGFTLDFPGGDTPEERIRRQNLGERNALWALGQPRDFLLYASLQPGQDPQRVLQAAPDGLALGGLAPFSRDHARLTHEVSRLRAAMPAGMPLHVFGIGAPDSRRTACAAGATSTDAASAQRHAASGAGLDTPSLAERLHLATEWLIAASAHPRPRGQLLTLPTGAGKTWRAIQAAREVVLGGGRVILTVPLKALAEEVRNELEVALPGVRVEAFTSDQLQRGRYRDAQVLVLTPERLDFLSREWRRHLPWLGEVGLLIADELHLLRDPVRGPRLAATLTRLRQALPHLKLWGLTATCGNPDETAAWLGAEHVGGGVRPVPLQWSRVRAEQSDQRLRAVVNTAASAAPPVLVFCNSRSRTAQVAAALQKAGLSADLHHAGLGRERRVQVERQYREGRLTALACTPTLELGVNLPAQTVVLDGLSRYAGYKSSVPLDVCAVWQRAGRAGRRAGDQPARVVLIGSQDELELDYEHATFESLEPHWTGEALSQMVLAQIRSGAYTRAQLQRFAELLPGQVGDLSRSVEALIQCGAVDATPDQSGRERLALTALGRICAARGLNPEDLAPCAALDERSTAFDVLIRLAGRLAPVRPQQPAVLEATLLSVPSRVLDDGGLQLWEAGVLHTASALWLCTEHGQAEAGAELGLGEGDLETLMTGAQRLLDAWLQWRPSGKLRLTRAMLGAGVPLDAATLTLLPGVGHAGARKLSRAGYDHLETLAQADEHRRLPGFSARRSAELIRAAVRLVAALDTDPGREPPASPHRQAWPLDLRPGIDPVRLRRSVHLSAVPDALVPDTWTVTGGDAPHVVFRRGAQVTCDCPDSAFVPRCKHVLAVQALEGDTDVLRMRDVLADWD